MKIKGILMAIGKSCLSFSIDATFDRKTFPYKSFVSCGHGVHTVVINAYKQSVDSLYVWRIDGLGPTIFVFSWSLSYTVLEL